MTQCATIGTYGAMAIHVGADIAAAAFGASSKQFEYQSENVRMTQEHAGGQGIRGTRSRRGGRNRIVAEKISGSIVLEPTPNELEVLWPLLLGTGSKSGSTFTLKELLPKFSLMLDKVVKRYVYDNCIVSKVKIAGSQKQPITITIDVEGKSETAVANTFASYAIPAIVDDTPYILADGVLILNSITTEFKSFSIEIDNALDADRFMNAVNRNCIPANDRIIKAQFGLPFTATTEPLHDLPAAGVAGSLVFTMGSNSTTFAFPKMQSPAETPGTKRGDESMLMLNFNCLSTAANNELVVTHVIP